MVAETKELCVSQEEQEVKLLRFLETRLSAEHSKTMLHKWIRTGQVRVNGKRCKPFDLLFLNDLVRIPPFAKSRQPESLHVQGALVNVPNEPTTIMHTAVQAGSLLLGSDLPVVGCTEEYFVVNKPAGLAVQGGTGIVDSVAKRLQRAFAGCFFTPAAVHRLDKQSSGLLLIGRTQRALRTLSQMFTTSWQVEKHYLAVVQGQWKNLSPMLLFDKLEQKRQGSAEFVSPAIAGASALIEENLQQQVKSFTAKGFNAVSIVKPVRAYCFAGKPATILDVQILTGRKHQIRVQLASRGHAILGDTRYTGLKAERLYLHASRLKLPDGSCYTSEPPWKLGSL